MRSQARGAGTRPPSRPSAARDGWGPGRSCAAALSAGSGQPKLAARATDGEPRHRLPANSRNPPLDQLGPIEFGVWADPLRMRTRRVREGFGGDGAAQPRPPARPPHPVRCPRAAVGSCADEGTEGKTQLHKGTSSCASGQRPPPSLQECVPRVRRRTAARLGPWRAGSTRAHVAQVRWGWGAFRAMRRLRFRAAVCDGCDRSPVGTTGRVEGTASWIAHAVRGPQQPPRRRPRARGRVGARAPCDRPSPRAPLRPLGEGGSGLIQRPAQARHKASEGAVASRSQKQAQAPLRSPQGGRPPATGGPARWPGSPGLAAPRQAAGRGRPPAAPPAPGGGGGSRGGGAFCASRGVKRGGRAHARA
jgi:hypothetical protein